MKKLQRDFTTPEQSKRLLELGVPADSANYYYGKDGKIHYIDGKIPCSLLWADGLVPCWSVGRLMEIYALCCPTDIDADIWLADSDTYLNSMIAKFELAFEDSLLDFSKLED